jgi:Rrf2 family protein
LSKVLNISEAATIAIHSMGIIARSNDSLNVQQIADLTGFSKNHTAKVLQQLVKNNFLTSSRGPKGGFIIKKDPSEITLMDIYKIIEGDIETEETLCKMHCDNCPFSNCIFGGLNEKFSREFKHYLMEKTLATI